MTKLVINIGTQNNDGTGDPLRTAFNKVNSNFTEVYSFLSEKAVYPSQVNRAGAKDSIIEGDKAAGSYDKIMIADFAMSLSRQKKDKVNGTGRFHIMKNRYGMDGMTFNAKVDTSTGHIDILNEMTEEEEDAQNVKPKQTKTEIGLDNLDKEYLAKQFFALNK